MHSHKVYFLILLAFCACRADDQIEVVDQSKDDSENFVNANAIESTFDNAVGAAERSALVEKKAKKVIENFLKQLPCGFPDQGIPPLAPYTKYDLEVEVARGVIDAALQMFYFRLDGLDDMQIKKLKIGVTFNKEVEFHFNFNQLKATAKTLNVLANLAGGVAYEDSGTLDFALQNLSVEGKFKYKLPIVFGSIEIYKFSITVKLGSVSSNIAGLSMSRVINKQLESLVPALINDNQASISKKLEAVLVPRINESLKGNKIWAAIGALLKPKRKCKATPPPW